MIMKNCKGKKEKSQRKVQKGLIPGERSKYCVEQHTKLKAVKVRRAPARCTPLLDWAANQWARTQCPLWRVQ